MSFIKALGVSATGLYAQKKKIEIVSENIANSESIITENGQPYRRKTAIFGEKMGSGGFSSALDSFSKAKESSGVYVTNVIEDNKPPKIVYDPEHPLASEAGYITLPNIDTTEEMLDLMQASRAYEANTTVLNATKSMFAKSLEIVR